MSEFKIGDIVEVAYKPCYGIGLMGERGKVIGFNDDYTTVEFGSDIDGHDCQDHDKYGHCREVRTVQLKKIEETKAETLERKTLEALREAIGVDVGEEFDVYKNEKKQWTCKFEETGFFREMDDDFYKSEAWKNLVCDFHNYQFMIKPFIPKEQEDYWYFGTKDSNEKLLFLKVLKHSWQGRVFDYGMLALGNVFRTEDDALKNEDKVLKRLEELRNGEKS